MLVSDQTPEMQPGHSSAETSAAGRVLVDTPWGVGPALALVVVAWAFALLAGGVVAQLGATALSPIVRTGAATGIILAMYAALLGIVWGSASPRGVRFADSVALARAGGLGWYAIGLAAAVLSWGFSAAFLSVLSAWGVKLPREDLAVFRLLPSGPLGVTLTIILLVVVAPFAEEIVYRGVLLSSLDNRWGAAVALVGSAAVFSAAHLSLVGFVPLLVAGLLFGWVFVQSRSLRVAIFAHAAYNALGVVALFATKGLGIQ
jgi:membrane protease YdiL (CAAX protease family)